MDIPVQGQSQDYTIPLKVIFNIWSRFQLSTVKIIAWNVLTGCETSASRLPRFAIIQVNLERTGTRILVKGRTLASPPLSARKQKSGHESFFEMYSQANRIAAFLSLSLNFFFNWLRIWVDS
jgi:hypothetical protein